MRHHGHPQVGATCLSDFPGPLSLNSFPCARLVSQALPCAGRTPRPDPPRLPQSPRSTEAHSRRADRDRGWLQSGSGRQDPTLALLTVRGFQLWPGSGGVSCPGDSDQRKGQPQGGPGGPQLQIAGRRKRENALQPHPRGSSRGRIPKPGLPSPAGWGLARASQNDSTDRQADSTPHTGS